MKTYLEAREHQLREWVAGRPWHNPFNHDDTRHDGDTSQGECCPDFSCCQPSLLAPQAAREAFAKADDETRFKMLGMFLSGCVAEVTKDTEVNVHVSTGDTEH